MNSNTSTYQCGNTVRFECKFYDFDNNKVNPDVAKLIVYNYKYEIIHEKLVDGGVNLGEYSFDYVTENKAQRLYYEWYGEINGKPSLKRGEFATRFI